MEISDPPEVSSDEGQSMVPDMLDLVCDPCSEDGNHKQAEGYCVDCKHFLCKLCFQHHLRPKPCKNHHLLDIQQMPLSKPDTIYKDECTDKCETHNDKLLEYFCEDHKVLGCTVCVTLGHRTCTVGFIPNLSDNLFDSLEYQQFKAAVETLAKNIKTFQDTMARNFNDIKAYSDTAMGEVRKFRHDVDSFFDELEGKISKNILQNQMEDQTHIQATSEQCKILAEEIEKIHQEIDDKEMKNQKCRLCIDIKHLHKTIDDHKTTVNKLRMDKQVKGNIFISSSVVSDLIHDLSQQFGTLIPISVIPVSMDTDANESSDIDDITILSNGRIVVSDSKNTCLKIIDIKHGMKKMSKSMSEFTLGITAISDKEIAVAQGGDIEIYSVGDQLTLQRTIKKAGLYSTLVYTNNTFIGCAVESPFTVRMVNMNGAVVNTYPTEFNGEILFKFPWYMAINKNHTLIYVSDPGTRMVTCLSVEGQVNARYRHTNMWDPRGVAVSDDGLVYVNDIHNNIILILTADIKVYGVLDGKQYGIKDPEGLAYCQRERKLYVGMLNRKELVVLNI